jgi:hypothetical protein
VLEALAREAAQLLHATGEAISRALELREAWQARATEGLAGLAGRGDVGKRLGDDRRELVLEARDLRPQRCSRRALAGPCAILDGACVELLVDVLENSGDGRLAGRSVRIDDWLLVLAHTRLLVRRKRRFYQRPAAPREG